MDESGSAATRCVARGEAHRAAFPANAAIGEQTAKWGFSVFTRGQPQFAFRPFKTRFLKSQDRSHPGEHDQGLPQLIRKSRFEQPLDLSKMAALEARLVNFDVHSRFLGSEPLAATLRAIEPSGKFRPTAVSLIHSRTARRGISRI